MDEVDVLVAGAGPVGLTAAAELRRRGVRCRIVDVLPVHAPFAKAVGIQPRTLEVFESMGLIRTVLDAAVPLRGQLVFVNGEQVARTELTLPGNVPHALAALPRYETEGLLTELLESRGTSVERGVELTSFEQDTEWVRARVTGPSGDEVIRARCLVGCDGAHSVVRHGPGLGFEGAAFPEQYMLGDGEVDRDMPPGFGVRSMHRSGDDTDDLLVCVPLPGRNRYRMSMLVPDELRMGTGSTDEPAHGLESGRAPELHHIQAVLDRLAPQPTVASTLRWSSIFRISHRLVDRYSHGRVFVAGDPAHIHPPTGAQGMNTGIQDAHDLAWKLALALDGVAADDLLDSYHAERRPVGEEVVGRTVRHARTGLEADPGDPATVVQREAQRLISYRESPIVGGTTRRDSPGPGDRAPDCGGLTRPLVGFPVRLFELLAGRDHTLVLYADEHTRFALLRELAISAGKRAHGRLDVHVIVAPATPVNGLPAPVAHDDRREFRDPYAARGGEAFLVRPDGHLGFRGESASADGFAAHLATVFAP